MKRTLDKYRLRIQSGRINPVVRWDGCSTGLIFDPTADQTPLTMLGFGACCLDTGPHRIETRDREFVFVPIVGEFELRVGLEMFKGRRQGGPFATLPGKSNASAIYVPTDATVELTGTGEMVYFTAPTTAYKPPAFVKPGQRENIPRGEGLWLREVITMFTPDDVTTVLVGGETYSPPGLWSGTPLHMHDLDDPAGGQSDHEEVYYHLARITEGQWGPFGVQMLFDDKGLDKAFVIHHRDAVAIPGGAHPVIAGPNSDMLYVWCLGGSGSSLAMLDVPEFAYLKKIGEIISTLTRDNPRKPLSAAKFNQHVKDNEFDAEQAHILRMHLRQQGIDVQG